MISVSCKNFQERIYQVRKFISNKSIYEKWSWNDFCVGVINVECNYEECNQCEIKSVPIKSAPDAYYWKPLQKRYNTNCTEFAYFQQKIFTKSHFGYLFDLGIIGLCKGELYFAERKSFINNQISIAQRINLKTKCNRTPSHTKPNLMMGFGAWSDASGNMSIAGY